MKKSIVLFCLFFAAAIFFQFHCSQTETNQQQAENDTIDSSEVKTEPFDIKRGVNISHWLSQSEKRGEARDTFFTEKDVELIKSFGYDHIRLPIDEEQMWNEQGKKNLHAFGLLHNGIKWCLKHDLRVIVDLHIIRAHHFNRNERPLWNNIEEQNKFVGFWKELSDTLKHYPLDSVAYELMNEAVTDEPEQWNSLIEKTVTAIRKNEPNRKIVVGSNRWQSVHTFKDLRVPPNDQNIILSFHFYEPLIVTHYKANWTKVGEYEGEVQYPGKIVDSSDAKNLPEDLKQEVWRHAHIFTKDTIDAYIQKALRKAEKLNLQLYCGEWGCLPTVPQDDRLQWYSDVRSVLEKYNIAWSNWDYKGGFGIVNRKTRKPNEELIEVLLK